MSALASKVKSNPEEECKHGSADGHTAGEGSEANKDNSEIAGLPDEMICAICLNARKSVMIQTCKHVVFCNQCDKDYKIKNHMDLKCPICMKKYSKTLQVLFS